MKWAHYKSLKPAARRAFDKGDGRHGKFIVDGQYIAATDKSGRAMDWVFIVRGPANQTIITALERVLSE